MGASASHAPVSQAEAEELRRARHDALQVLAAPKAVEIAGASMTEPYLPGVNPIIP